MSLTNRCLLFFLFLIAIAGPVSGETLFLKSGRKIEGRIIERSPDYIVLDFQGVPIKYYRNDIYDISQTGEKINEAVTIEPLHTELYDNRYTASQLLILNRLLGEIYDLMESLNRTILETRQDPLFSQTRKQRFDKITTDMALAARRVSTQNNEAFEKQYLLIADKCVRYSGEAARAAARGSSPVLKRTAAKYFQFYGIFLKKLKSDLIAWQVFPDQVRNLDRRLSETAVLEKAFCERRGKLTATRQRN